MVALNDILAFFRNNQSILDVYEYDELLGANIMIKGAINIREARQNDITFITNKFENNADELLNRCCASLVVIEKSLYDKLKTALVGVLTNHFHIIVAMDAKKA